MSTPSNKPSKMNNVDSLSLILQDSHKAEMEMLPDNNYMLYAYLWQNEAPVSIGVQAWVWAKVEKKYPQYAKKVEMKS